MLWRPLSYDVPTNLGTWYVLATQTYNFVAQETRDEWTRDELAEN